MNRWVISCALNLIFLSACIDNKDSTEQGPIVIDARGSQIRSTTAGNLIATAMQDFYKVDMVFYPSVFLNTEQFAIVEKNLDAETIQKRILPLYPDDKRDEFLIGNLSGAEIRKFILDRTSDNYQLDLQVAGLEYDIQYSGGLPTLYQISRPRGIPLEDKQSYRVAISRQQYGIPYTFPGYQYRNGFENNFEREPGSFSARAALLAFLQRFRQVPLLNEPRAQLHESVKGAAEAPLSIQEIQGRAHLSPWMGYRVQTQGVITALASKVEGGMDMYVQNPVDDGDPLTSNALNVYLAKARPDLKVGQLIAVQGIVYEMRTSEGLTRTALRNIVDLQILQENVPLPEPVAIGGSQGLKIPSRLISSYRGNLNQKTQLNLNDGVDFWESLEAMRIKAAKPRVVGFRGGKEKFDDEKEGYLTILAVPEGVHGPEEKTGAGGTFLDANAANYTPEVLRIVANELAPQVTPDLVFDVGDEMAGDLEGILSFQSNTFGSGEYVFYVTGNFSSPKNNIRPLEQRPQTRLVADDDHLTYVTWNLENLGGDKKQRIRKIGQAIQINLKCPDIITLPEVQDNNGVDFDGGSAADQTLAALIKNINCPGTDYRAININPVPNQDGGEPGGNIRVAALYNANRVGFEERGPLLPLEETYVLPDGTLNQNPGRLKPNDPTFDHSRKALVTEFTFKGQRFIAIGNHLNSKLGDQSLWQAEQPADLGSEAKRARMAGKIHDFVAQILRLNPALPVIVAGDFNAYWYENSLRMLAGGLLKNLMTYSNLCPTNEWYTTNYDGGASAIDHVFVTAGFLAREPEIEIVHFNSDFMGKLSDHDPVVTRFNFGTLSL